MLELVDKDAGTTSTNILHMFKSRMKTLWKIQKKMKRHEKYNIWYEKYTEMGLEIAEDKISAFKDIAKDTIQK